MNGGEHMKDTISLLLIIAVLFTFVGVAIAKEMSGQVTAVNAEKGTITLKAENLEAGFDCEEGSILKNVKVGDHVTVEYKEKGGKKIVTKITPMKEKPAAGGY
jgi:Cu/Ag efflux protein CusF